MLTWKQRWFLVGAWTRTLIMLLGIRLRVLGELPEREKGLFIVCNHISWIDIPIVFSVCPVSFVSKSEVKNWPIIGHWASCVGTIFIERRRKSDVLRVSAAIKNRLEKGGNIFVFPEGTTSSGKEVLPFNASLLQIAVDLRLAIKPVSLKYTLKDGSLAEHAAYIDNDNILNTMFRVLCSRKITAELNFLHSVKADGCDRRLLASELRSAIRHSL